VEKVVEKKEERTGWKTIKIQQLEPVKKKDYEYDSGRAVNPADTWKSRMCNHRGWDNNKKCTCQILTYLENRPATQDSYGHSLYSAFVSAYNKHEDVVISPDDIWLTIAMEFSVYVNRNAEALRKFFVSHDGKMKLTVTTGNETGEDQWDEFFRVDHSCHYEEHECGCGESPGE